MWERLTHSSTLHILGRDPQNSQYLHHNLDEHVFHSRSRRHLAIDLEPAEERLEAVGQVDEYVLADTGIFGRLEHLNVKLAEYVMN
jgi:hypothetical protein